MDKTLLLTQLRKKTTKRSPKDCSNIFVRRTLSPLEKMVVDTKTMDRRVVHMDDTAYINTLLSTTRYVPRIKANCRFTKEPVPLVEVVSPRALVVDPSSGKTWVRMFHGARSQHLISILKYGLQPIGKGVLGTGFYMTPSLEKALLYTAKDQQLSAHSKTNPIVMEILLPTTSTVCCIDRSSPGTCCSSSTLFTEHDHVWQFVCKDNDILQTFPYRIWLL